MNVSESNEKNNTESDRQIMPVPASDQKPVNVASYEDSLDAYLQKISQIPLLTHEQEVEHARRYRESKDMQAAQYLVLSNLRFVVYVAKGFKGYGLPLSDIIQEGNVGLMRAVTKFDPDHGVRFISYAVYWIRYDINEYIIKNMRMVKTATTKEKRKLLFNLNKHIRESHGRLSVEDRQRLAKQYGVKVADIEVIETTLSNHDSSLDYQNPSGLTTMELLPGKEMSPDEAHMADSQGVVNTGIVSKMLSQLNDRQRDIIRARWLSDEKVSLEDLAAQYGISMQRVSQIEKQALAKCQSMGLSVEDVLLTQDAVD